MISRNARTRTIGLILEDVFTDFAHDIIHSVSFAVRDRKDLRLVIVAGRQDNSTDPYDMTHRYKTRYNLIYQMNAPYRFDGLLLAFPNLTCMQRGFYRDIPKVYLAATLPDELTVNYDDGMGIREAVDYLVRIKDVTRLCMLGGREDNADARRRRRLFRQALEDNGLAWNEGMYEPADMSTQTQEPAARLLARNPDTQAVFCVNDATAAGLYDVLRGKELTPGKDVYVFGFDNGQLAANMTPPLASIGADGMTLGQKALELLLEKMDGEDVSSRLVPTHLYGRDSLEYGMSGVSAREMLNADPSVINSFFDNCFYRYRNEIVGHGNINLKRLFFEIYSRILKAMKNRIMADDEYAEIRRLIEVLFRNGIMLYTDPNRFVRHISSLQNAMNETMKPGLVCTRINHLFSLIRDKAIQFHGVQRNSVIDDYNTGRNRILDFLTWTTNYGSPGEKALDYMIHRLDRIGLKNAALFLYREPVRYGEEEGQALPETVFLRCVLRNGELFVIPGDRQECPASEIYDRSELPPESLGYISYPLFCGEYLFGILVSAMDEKQLEIGEFLAFQLSRSISVNWLSR